MNFGALVSQEKGIYISDDLRANLLYNNNYHSCRVLTGGNVVSRGESSNLKLEVIAFIPLNFEVGDSFQLAAGKEIYADCIVNKVQKIENIKLDQ